MALLTLFLAYIAYQQNGISERQLEVMRVEQRPWVEAEISLAKPITFNSAGNMEVDLHFVFQNIGHNPAMSVWPNWIPILVELNPDIDALQETFCGQMASLPTKARFGQALFPGQRVSMNEREIIKSADIRSAVHRDGGTEALIPAIIGCIDYDTIGPSSHHQTRFAYMIVRSRPDAKGDSAIRPSGGTIPKEDISLMPDYDGRAFFAY